MIQWKKKRTNRLTAANTHTSSPLEAQPGELQQDAEQVPDEAPVCPECMQTITNPQELRLCMYDQCQRPYHHSCTFKHLAANNLNYFCNTCSLCDASTCVKPNREVIGNKSFNWCYNCRHIFHKACA